MGRDGPRSKCAPMPLYSWILDGFLGQGWVIGSRRFPMINEARVQGWPSPIFNAKGDIYLQMGRDGQM